MARSAGTRLATSETIETAASAPVKDSGSSLVRPNRIDSRKREPAMRQRETERACRPCRPPGCRRAPSTTPDRARRRGPCGHAISLCPPADAVRQRAVEAGGHERGREHAERGRQSREQPLVGERLRELRLLGHRLQQRQIRAELRDDAADVRQQPRRDRRAREPRRACPSCLAPASMGCTPSAAPTRGRWCSGCSQQRQRSVNWRASGAVDSATRVPQRLRDSAGSGVRTRR